MRRESHSMATPMTKSYGFIEQYHYSFIRQHATLVGAVGVRAAARLQPGNLLSAHRSTRSTSPMKIGLLAAIVAIAYSGSALALAVVNGTDLNIAGPNGTKLGASETVDLNSLRIVRAALRH